MTFKRCIVFLADGSRADVFDDLLQKGKLPHIQKYLVDRGCSKTAVSVFPSTTGPAYAPVLTGCFPSTVGIPGIRWFDRQKFSQKRFSLSRFRSYVGYETFLMNRDMNPGTKTLFEYFPRSYNIFSPITRGSGFFRNRTKILKSIYWVYAHYKGNWSAVDNKTKHILWKLIPRDFEFIFAVFPGIDEYAHLDTPFCENTINAYITIDQTLAKTAELLKKQNRLDDTLFILTSDHGLTATHTHLEMFGLMNSLGYKTFHYPKVWRNHVDAASMVSGNGMAHIYLKGNNGWNSPVRFEDIPQNVIETVLKREEIDLFAAPNAKDEVVVIGKSGRAALSLHNGKIHYAVEGDDPFGYPDMPEAMTPEEELAQTISSLYPDAPYQLVKLFESPRAGTFIVNAVKGYDLRDRYENPEHHSTHGSLHREHMLVPFAANIPLQCPYLRNADIYCLILNSMGKSYNPDTIDGTIRE